MKGARVGVALVLLVALAASVWARMWLDAFQSTPVAREALRVDPGTSARTVLRELLGANHGLHERLVFGLFPRLATVHAGQYRFQAGSSVFSAMDQVARGDTVLYRFTIPEGLRSQEVFAAAHATPGVLQSANEPFPESLLDPRIPHLEGAFLAETYAWKGERHPHEILLLAHQALVTELDAVWATRVEAVDQVLSSPYELLILASIVEKETALATERARIAGVFIERLSRGMRLQTDPTVIYGLGDAFDGNLTRAHLRQPTAYNTYRIEGLPPTPIAVVGPDSLAAVARPEITGELYFVADGSGGHAFSRTLEEHNANVRRYQLSGRAR